MLPATIVETHDGLDEVTHEHDHGRHRNDDERRGHREETEVLGGQLEACLELEALELVHDDALTQMGGYFSASFQTPIGLPGIAAKEPSGRSVRSGVGGNLRRSRRGRRVERLAVLRVEAEGDPRTLPALRRLGEEQRLGVFLGVAALALNVLADDVLHAARRTVERDLAGLEKRAVDHVRHQGEGQPRLLLRRVLEESDQRLVNDWKPLPLDHHGLLEVLLPGGEAITLLPGVLVEPFQVERIAVHAAVRILRDHNPVVLHRAH